MKIFLSYRRDDSGNVVDRIDERLRSHFGERSVFRDIHDIPLGTDYRTTLNAALKQCDVLVALIGERWLDAVNADGRRRLELPTDWVRIEIESALSRKIHVIPLILDAASCPKSIAIPESIAQLAFQQSHRMRTSEDFDLDMAQLISAIIELEPFAGNVEATLTFELRSDRQWESVGNSIIEAHTINKGIVSLARHVPLRVLSWHGQPYRVTFESNSAGFATVLEAYLSGKLDKATKAHWVSCELVRSDEVRADAVQVPLMSTDSRVNKRAARSLVCHLNAIQWFENEWLESQDYIGSPTSDPKALRAYISRGYNGDLYVHSNFIKQDSAYPTKIQTNEPVDLLTIFENLVIANESQFQLQLSLQELHQHHARYFVNERRVPKGDASFFTGATHVYLFIQPGRLLNGRSG